VSSEAIHPERAVLTIPVKSFSDAKHRLSAVLNTSQRARLSRELATRLVDANRSLHPMIVSDDDTDVAKWAHDVGARFLHEPRLGLNPAITTAHATLRAEGVSQIVVAHSDLAVADKLEWVTEFDGITLVPDRGNDGTNIIALPTHIAFEFSYGVGSFARHYRSAAETGLPIRVVADRTSGSDIDSPQDLRALRSDLLSNITDSSRDRLRT
jgi:2-phospho-L-lactate/phosphoenolpyruvate guanylyltransferase